MLHSSPINRDDGERPSTIWRLHKGLRRGARLLAVLLLRRGAVLLLLRRGAILLLLAVLLLRRGLVLLQSSPISRDDGERPSDPSDGSDGLGRGRACCCWPYCCCGGAPYCCCCGGA